MKFQKAKPVTPLNIGIPTVKAEASAFTVKAVPPGGYLPVHALPVLHAGWWHGGVLWSCALLVLWPDTVISFPLNFC